MTGKIIKLVSLINVENRKNSREVPLSIVEKDSHIYYNKGAVSMYQLQELIGEKQVNLALKRFVKDWNAFDPNFKKERYATTKDLLQYIYEVTPVALKTTVFELLETVTTYDADIKKAVVLQNENDSFAINVQLTLEKWQENTKGIAVKVTPTNAIVALSIYGLDADGNEVLLETKEIHMLSETTDLVFKSKTKPSRIVLDEHYLLLDINRENNSTQLD